MDETNHNPALFPTASVADNWAEPTLLDVVDHILNRGVVLHGSIVISLAGVDLVYLGVNAVLTSVETALKHINAESLKSK
ncbi:MAG: gas vesicle protein [Acidobacteriaceae bacterium]